MNNECFDRNPYDSIRLLAPRRSLVSEESKNESTSDASESLIVHAIKSHKQIVPIYIVEFRAMNSEARSSDFKGGYTDLLNMSRNIPGWMDIQNPDANLSVQKKIIKRQLDTAIVDLNADNLLFRIAESQFLTCGGSRCGRVTKVEVAFNQTLIDRYRKKRQKFRSRGVDITEIFVFHGTNPENYDLILRDGFKVGGEEVSISNGAVHGHGVYTATGVSAPMQYAGGANRILLALAIKGSENDHKSPRDDWILFKSKEQLLPLFVVHY